MTDTSVKIVRLIAMLLLAATIFGCLPYSPRRTTYPSASEADPLAGMLDEDTLPGEESSVPLKTMGYSIQVGAFGNLDNAVRLEQLLQRRGIDAYYFRHESGLFKVRFGDHASYRNARNEAEQLQAQGLIEVFFIVMPEDYMAARIRKGGAGNLRDELVTTARRFLGVPYRWGGTDRDNGFDCSGLTMVCYRLNGLNLPRVSRSQYQAGRSVSQSRLQKGDLVFFATNGGRRVSHVGMYIGNGQFIHAPRTGQKVRIEKLSDSFFSRTYVGARSYL
jgi:hypothetical protein